MMDVSRHFMPVDVVKRNLDAMAFVKLNVFHWHLSDDQGFRVEVYVSDEGVHLGESVRSEEKREVMRLVQEDMEEQLQASNVPITIGTITDTEMEAAFSAGAIPLVMISSWQIYGERFPHWVVVTGFDEHFVYVNDPYVDHEQGETALDSIHMPIARERFASMARYGRVKLQAVVFLSAPRTGKRRSAVSKRNS
jgi:hypothetical protein